MVVETANLGYDVNIPVSLLQRPTRPIGFSERGYDHADEDDRDLFRV